MMFSIFAFYAKFENAVLSPYFELLVINTQTCELFETSLEAEWRITVADVTLCVCTSAKNSCETVKN